MYQNTGTRNNTDTLGERSSTKSFGLSSVFRIGVASLGSLNMHSSLNDSMKLIVPTELLMDCLKNIYNLLHTGGDQ